MIRHIVLLKARPAVSEAEIATIFAELAAIRATVPGVLAIHSGRSESPEKIERGYLHGFRVDFADWAALAAYQDHPITAASVPRSLLPLKAGSTGSWFLTCPAEARTC